MQINLLTLSQSELCVELRPRPSSSLMSNELEPLRLTVTWNHDDRFTLQVSLPSSPLPVLLLLGANLILIDSKIISSLDLER